MKIKKNDDPLNFPKFPNEDKMSQTEICLACTGCCRYVNVIIEKPKNKTLRDQYTWYLLHKNVQIYIDNDKDWNLLFITPCTALQSDGKCSVYEDRPEMCKDYDPESCSRTGEDHIALFETSEQMFSYLDKNKKTIQPKSKKKR